MDQGPPVCASEADAPPAGDVAGAAARPASIPSRHAINQAFREISAAAASNGLPGHWLQWPRADIARKALDADAIAREIERGPTSASLTSLKRRDGRRLGRPISTFDIGRVVADRFIAHGPDGWSTEQEVLVLRRETVEVRPDHLEERSSPSGVAVTRHALERLYERERCEHCEIRGRILGDLSQADRTLSFAIAGGLFVKGGPFDTGACTALPLGQGLLLVRNVPVAMRAGASPVTRYVVTKRGLVSTPVRRDALRHLDMPDLDGIEVQGYLIAMGLTYISLDLLYLEQKAYLALFEREAARFDLSTLAADVGRTWLPHEKRPPTPSIDLDPRLRYLLNQIVPPRPRVRTCLSIGWTRREDPRREGEKQRTSEGENE